MDKKLNPADFKKAPHAIDNNDLLRRIASGGAVLFAGSGFSYRAPAVCGSELPTAIGLARDIGRMGGFDSDDDLRYASDRFLNENNPDSLVQYLVEQFSVGEPQPHHITIASQDWRRIYTTNYDLLVEKSAEKMGKVIQPVEVSMSPGDHWQKHGICVHINGSIRSLTADTINTSFKLSNSSYLSPESFANSEWGFPFKRDLELASAIVFVGYSLYDIEVQKILFQAPELKEKTYFVCREDEPEKQKYILERYGHVLTIGAEQFAAIIGSSLSKFKRASDETEPKLFVRYEIEKTLTASRDSDVDRMLLYGDIPDSLVDSSLTSDHGAPILIIRDEIHGAEKILESGKSVVVTSDFGNGKSIFCRTLKSSLSLKGFPVYSLEENDPFQFSDIEILAKQNSPCFLFIDDYELFLPLVQHYCAIAPNHLRLVLSARTAVLERTRKSLIENGLSFSEISVDQLSDLEAERLVAIFDNAGLWGEQASLPHERKIALITSKNRRQLSLTLLDQLESPQILGRVTDLLTTLLANNDHKATVFAITLLEVVGSPLRASLISEVALNDSIYSPELRLNQSFRELFHINGSSVSTKSSLFALSILRNQFSSAYAVDRLLRIVDSFERERSNIREKQLIFKNLLRFSVIERLLPEKNKKVNLVRYYEELKRHSEWLTRDPHFWLQYAMTQINFEEFSIAQKYLNQAYALARTRHNYHTAQFDTQQARMWLQMGANHEDQSEAFKLFESAHNLLRSVASDLHKFWQYARYPTFYNAQYGKLSKGNRAAFEQACKSAISDIHRAVLSNELPFLEVSRSNQIREQLVAIVDEIANSRKNG